MKKTTGIIRETILNDLESGVAAILLEENHCSLQEARKEARWHRKMFEISLENTEQYYTNIAKIKKIDEDIVSAIKKSTCLHKNALDVGDTDHLMLACPDCGNNATGSEIL